MADSNTIINNKQVVELKNWCFNDYFRTLFGEAYGHHKFEDGTYVMTSRIRNAQQDLTGGCFTVETRNTIYICLFKDVHKDFSIYSVSELWKKLEDIVNHN